MHEAASRVVMSALGHKRTFAMQSVMTRDVRFVPIADITPAIRSPRRRGPTKGVWDVALAVFRLMTSSNLVGCSPRKMRVRHKRSPAGVNLSATCAQLITAPCFLLVRSSC